MSETMIAILETSLIFRAAAIMLIIWLTYLLVAGVLVRIVALIPILFNWVWVLVYKLIGGLMHILHSNFGKPFMGIDQTLSDFFGGIHGFVDNVKTTIQTAGKAKRPFCGTAFIIAFVITILIALPVWLDAHYDENLFTLPYRAYTSFENWLLHIMFSN